MNTTNKLAEALTLGLECAYELLAEKRQALAGHPEKVAPYQEMADYLRRELAAHEQAQAAPLKERPDFIAGYYAGLADGRRCAERDSAEQAAKAVAQWRKIGHSQWWDGHPDHEDGGGPYESRTLYTHAAPTPPAPEAQRMEPLTDEDWRTRDSSDTDEGCAALHRAHGIGATTGEQHG